MTDGRSEWTARVTVRLADPALRVWLHSSLGPEASREVPRARASVSSPDAATVEVAISARDVGAMRAALNTYLGWVDLALRTGRTAARPSSARSSSA